MALVGAIPPWLPQSLRDTAENIQALQADMIVIRHAAAGSPLYLSRILDIPVINAGDSWREHPTQALLDALTIRSNAAKQAWSQEVAATSEEAQAGLDTMESRQDLEAGTIGATGTLLSGASSVGGNFLETMPDPDAVARTLAKVPRTISSWLQRRTPKCPHSAGGLP